MISGVRVTCDTGQWPVTTREPGLVSSVTSREINQARPGVSGDQSEASMETRDQSEGGNKSPKLRRPSIYGGDLFTFQGQSWGILSLKLNKILILHGSNLWKGWRDFSLMKTSQSSIGRSRIYDHLLLTKIKFKYFPRVTKYSFSIWFATSRLWVICVNILSHLCLSLCPGRPNILAAGDHQMIII